MKVGVLGAAGTVGSVAVRDLVESPEVTEIIAFDINKSKLEKVKSQIKSRKIKTEFLNVNDENTLIRALKNVDVVANATYYKYVVQVTKAAIKAGTDYVDLGGLIYTSKKQLEFDKEAKDAGVSVVVCMGVSVGMTQVLAKYGANKLDQTHEIRVRCGTAELSRSIAGQFFYSAETILDEISQNAYIYENGRYIEVPPFSGEEKVKFLPPLGEMTAYHCKHSEVATIPLNIPGLKYLDYKLALSPETAKALKFFLEIGLTSQRPIKVKQREISPRDFLLKLVSAAPEVGQKNAIACKVELEGLKKNRKTKITYDICVEQYDKWGVSSVSYATAIPFSIVAQLLGKGEVKQKGILMPEQLNGEAILRELNTRDNYYIQETIQTIKRLTG